MKLNLYIHWDFGIFHLHLMGDGNFKGASGGLNDWDKLQFYPYIDILTQKPHIWDDCVIPILPPDVTLTN